MTVAQETLKQLMETTADAIIRKAEEIRPEVRGIIKPAITRSVVKALHIKQATETEVELAEVLAPVIKTQVMEIVKGLKEDENLEESDFAVRAVFKPEEHKAAIVDAVFPILAVKALESAVSQMMALGIDVRKKSCREKHLGDQHDQSSHGRGGSGWNGGAGESKKKEVDEAAKTVGKGVVGVLKDNGIRIIDSNRTDIGIASYGKHLGVILVRKKGVQGSVSSTNRAATADDIVHEMGHAFDACMQSKTTVLETPRMERGYWSEKGLKKTLEADRKAKTPKGNAPSWENPVRSWEYAYTSPQEAFAHCFAALHGDDTKVNGFAVQDAMPATFAAVKNKLDTGNKSVKHYVGTSHDANQGVHGRGRSGGGAVNARLKKEFDAVEPHLTELLAEAQTKEVRMGTPMSWEAIPDSVKLVVEEDYKLYHGGEALQSIIQYEAENMSNYLNDELALNGGVVDPLLDILGLDDPHGEWKAEVWTDWGEKEGLDAKSVQEAGKGEVHFEDGVQVHNVIDYSKLRKADGSSFTDEEINSLKAKFEVDYDVQKDKKIDQLIDAHLDDPPDYLQQQALDDVAEMFNSMDPETQFDYAKNSTSILEEMEETYEGIATPDTWKPYTNGTDYLKTRASASYLQRERTKEIMAEKMKGSTFDDGDADWAAVKMWSEWKASSTSDVGLAMQHASAEELGVKLHKRFNTPEYKRAIADGYKELGSHYSNRHAEEYGKAVAQAHMRATWESSQYVLKQAGLDQIEVYRGLKLNAKKVGMTGTPTLVEHDGHAYSKLTGMRLDANSAASTSVLLNKANNWNGIGVTETDTVRVVMRIKSPRESVLSIPAFGQNVTEEQEVVVLGSERKVDYWKHQAPSLEQEAL